MLNNMGLTKRERVALVIAAFLAVIFLFIPQQVLNEWEYLYLFFIVFPLGMHIATDPERAQRKGE